MFLCQDQMNSWSWSSDNFVFIGKTNFVEIKDSKPRLKSTFMPKPNMACDFLFL